MEEDIKAKISKTLKGKYVGDMSFRKGVPITDEHKAAISRANTGKKLSEETKRKLSEAHAGKVLSNEHKKKISEGGKGRICTAEQKERLRQSNLNKTQIHSRTIFAKCIKTNMDLNFNNISEAARYFNVTRHRIKNNLVEGWNFIVNDPAVSIKQLKMTTNGSESKNNTR